MKQAIIVNSEVKMSKGKTAAQVAHASVSAYEFSRLSYTAQDWFKNSMTKVVLKADLRVMRQLESAAKANGIPTAMIRDEGRTEIEPGTITALAIGPSYD